MSELSPDSLADRRVLVVGASAGIGRAFASQAIAGGAAVAVVGRRAERLAELVDGLPLAVAVAGDVRAPADCSRIVAEAIAALGGIDLLLYCAGPPLSRASSRRLHVHGRSTRPDRSSRFDGSSDHRPSLQVPFPTQAAPVLQAGQA